MYSEINLCVSAKNDISGFISNIVVRQGEKFIADIFSIYLNDLEGFLKQIVILVYLWNV